MRAIVQERYGPPLAVLAVAEVDKPEPGPGEVLVRVHASPVVGTDWHWVRGQPYVARVSDGMRRPKYRVPGFELSGTVAAVGVDVRTLAIEDEVYGWSRCTLAEYVAVPEGNLAPKPATLTLAQAAAVPLSGLTALQAVRDSAKVHSGQRVLVTGASGCVGIYAVQIAKALGAHVTAVCGAAKADLVRSLGADRVVDHATTKLVDVGDDFDAFLDIYGNPALSDCKRVLRPGGTLVFVGGTGGPWFMGTDRWLRGLLRAPFLGVKVRPLVHKNSRDDLVALTGLIESGALAPVLDRTYPLAEAAAAIEDNRAGRVRGHAVVVVESL
ncbi:NAD(P)-dependent alcohol dehydrogenase [Actinokineospora sp. NBRC 105648]|uniref:NAD(P)-dependent alcohol dehydrogenase n=1 Tax=Actinokineospora sp. NBRC 105648 TaxID=3032206 RepID=UPI0024A431D4|nr:NAD(P)-dependent alcohol dehydrogenase [Actinokineospora sp. NBRC 105648]GLZ40446.1 NADPH:quinone reductase [Actinokineospora sp. NBRC 105648]